MSEPPRFVAMLDNGNMKQTFVFSGEVTLEGVFSHVEERDRIDATLFGLPAGRRKIWTLTIHRDESSEPPRSFDAEHAIQADDDAF